MTWTVTTHKPKKFEHKGFKTEAQARDFAREYEAFAYDDKADVSKDKAEQHRGMR